MVRTKRHSDGDLPNELRTFTPPELARHLGIGKNQVLRLIGSGELGAYNIASDPDGERPRWRISLKAVLDFQERRRVRDAARASAAKSG